MRLISVGYCVCVWEGDVEEEFLLHLYLYILTYYGSRILILWKIHLCILDSFAMCI
jgi:hypothetical protein